MEEQVQSMEVLLSETEVWLHVNNTLVLLHINMNIIVVYVLSGVPEQVRGWLYIMYM